MKNTIQRIMKAVEKMDDRGRLVVATIASAVLQSQKAQQKTTASEKKVA